MSAVAVAVFTTSGDIKDRLVYGVGVPGCHPIYTLAPPTPSDTQQPPASIYRAIRTAAQARASPQVRHVLGRRSEGAGTCLAGCGPAQHDRVVVFGLALAVVGLVLAVFPRPLVAVATRYRISMPRRGTPDVIRAARVGAVIVMVVGVAIALA